MKKEMSVLEEMFLYQMTNQVSYSYEIYHELKYHYQLCKLIINVNITHFKLYTFAAYPSFETRNAGSGIEVDRLFLYPKENAGNHYTDKYELVSEQGISVLRRSAKFFLAINSKSRSIDLDGKDKVNVIFEFGKI